MYEYPAMYLNTYAIARSTHSTLAQSSTEHRIGSGPLQSKVPGGFRLASPDPSSSLTSPAGGSSLSSADTAGTPPATTAAGNILARLQTVHPLSRSLPPAAPYSYCRTQ